jgi:hypothetical protein
VDSLFCDLARATYGDHAVLAPTNAMESCDQIAEPSLFPPRNVTSNCPQSSARNQIPSEIYSRDQIDAGTQVLAWQVMVWRRHGAGQAYEVLSGGTLAQVHTILGSRLGSSRSMTRSPLSSSIPNPHTSCVACSIASASSSHTSVVVPAISPSRLKKCARYSITRTPKAGME